MKKFIAFALAVLMIFAIPSVSVFAISTNDAVVNIDFSKGIPDGMEVTGAELVNDDSKGQVMSFPGSAKNKKNGSVSKATIPMESLATTDFSAGISWTVWVKGTPETHGMQPIFTIDLTRIGYLTLLADLVVTANSDGNETKWGIERVWSDPPQPLEDEESAIGTDWNYFTVVIKNDGVYLYKNAKLFDSNPWSAGSFGNDGMTEIMMEEMVYATGVTLGAYNCDWWRFGDFKGFISSAALYNKALSADEIKELFVASGGIYEEPPTEAPTPEPTPAAPETTENNANATAANETTGTAATNDNNNNSSSEGESKVMSLQTILIIAGAVIIVAAVIIIIVVMGKKKKK